MMENLSTMGHDSLTKKFNTSVAVASQKSKSHSQRHRVSGQVYVNHTNACP